MLSFSLVPAGRMVAGLYSEPAHHDEHFYVEIQPISDEFEQAALDVNGLDRERLIRDGQSPVDAMRGAADWIRERCEGGKPVLVAYPLGFDWSWIHWYFVRYLGASPFGHSRGFDLKTAVALMEENPISGAGRSRLPETLRPDHPHTHHATDDAISQAQIFTKLMMIRNTPERLQPDQPTRGQLETDVRRNEPMR